MPVFSLKGVLISLPKDDKIILFREKFDILSKYYIFINRSHSQLIQFDFDCLNFQFTKNNNSFLIENNHFKILNENFIFYLSVIV